VCPPCVACSLAGFIFPQGLKPDFFLALIGAAEAVPLQIKIKPKPHR
jgi:hypothetical protein